MNQREEYMLESLRHIEEFIEPIARDPITNGQAAGIGHLVRNSDILCVAGADEDLADQGIPDGDFYSKSWRGDSDLLPPQAIIFQAMPDDAEILPTKTLELPVVYDSIVGESPSVDFRGMNSSQIALGEPRPVLGLPHYKHPLTQTIIDTRALSHLALNIQALAPEAEPTPHQKSVLFTNHRVKSWAMVSACLAEQGDSEAMTEWARESTQGWYDHYYGLIAKGENTPSPEFTQPPSDELREAYEADPRTEDVLQREGFRLLGLYGLFLVAGSDHSEAIHQVDDVERALWGTAD